MSTTVKFNDSPRDHRCKNPEYIVWSSGPACIATCKTCKEDFLATAVLKEDEAYERCGRYL